MFDFEMADGSKSGDSGNKASGRKKSAFDVDGGEADDSDLPF